MKTLCILFAIPATLSLVSCVKQHRDDGVFQEIKHSSDSFEQGQYRDGATHYGRAMMESLKPGAVHESMHQEILDQANEGIFEERDEKRRAPQPVYVPPSNGIPSDDIDFEVED